MRTEIEQVLKTAPNAFHITDPANTFQTIIVQWESSTHFAALSNLASPNDFEHVFTIILFLFFFLFLIRYPVWYQFTNCSGSQESYATPSNLVSPHDNEQVPTIT